MVTLDSFIMEEVGNLDTCLGVTLVYFHNIRGGEFIRKDNRSDGYYN